jgi:hypothetical protein
MFWSILNQSKTFFNKTMISIGIMVKKKKKLFLILLIFFLKFLF